MLDITNFEDYTEDEYRANLNRLGIVNHSDLIGKQVYYSREIYGKHTVISFSGNTGLYVLDCDGTKFTSNPFRILKIV